MKKVTDRCRMVREIDVKVRGVDRCKGQRGRF